MTHRASTAPEPGISFLPRIGVDTPTLDRAVRDTRWQSHHKENITMSPISHDLLLRSFAVAGILSLAALGTPTTAHAQTHATRALLNRVALPSVAPRMAFSQTTVPAPAADAVNGERALLARTAYGADLDPAGRGSSLAPLALPVDGARALLGRWSEGGRP
jgi:hypothetical protein